MKKHTSPHESDKRKILTCPKLNYSRLEDGKKRQRVEQLTERAKDNIQQKTAHMPECMLKLESASGRVFELLSRETSWPPDSTAPCVHMNFLDFCPQPIQRQHTLLP